MRIVFVRHGHPDYSNDCLTPLGQRHALAAAKRLEGVGIGQIFASTRGRAMETAQIIAQTLGLSVIPCDFMREISWGSVDEQPIFQKGHPWYTAWDMVAHGLALNDPQWHSKEPFCRNKAVASVQAVQEGLDRWLSELGFAREGLYYRVPEKDPGTVAMVSHGGSSAAALARLFDLPFPLVCGCMNADFTAVTVVALEGEPGSLICPRFEILNDARHIAGID